MLLQNLIQTREREVATKEDSVVPEVLKKRNEQVQMENDREILYRERDEAMTRVSSLASSKLQQTPGHY